MNRSKSIFAVCDLEVEYAYNFMEYMNQKKNIPFEVQAFTGPDVLCEYAWEHPIEILLISGKAMCDAVKQLKVGMLVILSEGVHNPDLDQYPSVYKYQSSDSVIREVMSCYGAEKAPHQKPPVLKKGTRVIGIYSPIGRTQKTSFALTLGQVLAKDRAVLYLNLENFSGFDELMEQSFEHTLSDLLYFTRQENVNLSYKMGGMIQSIQNLDFVPPALSPMDIQSTTYEEWVMLLDMVTLDSSYEYLILDLGDGVNDLFRILESCEQIYVPVRNDIISLSKINQFEHLLGTWGHEKILGHMKKVKLPFHTINRTGRAYFENLVWSELGDFVRSLLRKEESS